MEQNKAINLLLRQVNDIKNQAERIMAGDNSGETIEMFSHYLDELRNYINLYIENEEVKYFTEKLPRINFKRNQVQLWQYLILPVWWIGIFKENIAKNKTITEIRECYHKYSELELLLRQAII